MLNSLNALVAPLALVGHFVGLKLQYLIDNSIAKRIWAGGGLWTIRGFVVREWYLSLHL
jgi:hypothetical protein